MPGAIALYAGDVLWACLVYLSLILVWPNLSRRSAATVALAFSLFIEVSQLYHPPWLDALRTYRLGGLMLGFGFLWSDLVCYACGVALGTILDQALSD